ncbi:AraC family transcriptional regulator [Vibrio sp. MarTm2]|uniref:AraC family transcriptional regulator n=1 Tax=Vibrio sp. MarTm2 TaxID=2998831 RepID=UPI0022CD3971|nr:AraC family transcriptional regulator [Vibrio sp. MarTm2]MDA0128487.1 AraC family transcriptional regulator [Vibrio sp. MarTm2]
MHYAISHQTSRYDFLHSTARRKLLKHTLFQVKEGLVLVKLGKLEYAVEPGQSFWLPFDTLCAVSYFPNTHVQCIDISSRVQVSLPKQGGFVSLTELAQAIISRLSDDSRNPQNDADLLTVLKADIAQLTPALQESTLTQQINQWAWDSSDSALLNEHQLVLKIREAKKRLLSGNKRAQVIKQMFDGNEALFTQLESITLGD